MDQNKSEKREKFEKLEKEKEHHYIKDSFHSFAMIKDKVANQQRPNISKYETNNMQYKTGSRKTQ